MMSTETTETESDSESEDVAVLLHKYDANAVQKALDWKANNPDISGWSGVADRFSEAFVGEGSAVTAREYGKRADGVSVDEHSGDEIREYVVPEADTPAIKRAVSHKADDADVAGWDGVEGRIVVLD